MKHATILLCLLAAVAPALATDYYVSPDGDDANPGTLAAPFRTIARASSVLQPGDVCHLRAGVYREVIRPARSGTAAAPITYRAYAGEEATVTALDPVSDWVVDEGRVFRAAVTLRRGDYDAVYFNGELMDRARWPNNTDDDVYTIDAEPITGGTGSYMDARNLTDADLAGGYLWYLGAHSGASWTRPITSVSGKRISYTPVDINRWPFNPHNPTVFRNGNRGRFFVFGTRALLDHPREWHYGNGTLYFQPPGGGRPADGAVEYAARERTVHLDQQYIVVSGLRLVGGKVHIALRAQHNRIENNVILHGLQRIDDLNNTTAQVGEGSVHVQAANTAVVGNRIEYGSLNGIFVQRWGEVSDVLIEQNEIRFFNTVGNHSSPIRANCDRAVIRYNTIAVTGRDGIFLPGQDCEFAYNDVAECMQINNDGGMFYVVGDQNDKNTEVHHNWFHDSSGPEYADGRTAGIYLDNNSKGYDVHHNVVWDISWSGVQMNWSAWNNDIINNSFFGVDMAVGVWLNGHSQINNRIINNYADVGPWEGQEERNNFIRTASPFEDFANRDFRPAAGSPLIDMGREVAGFTDGCIEGSAPDIGAYERGKTPWVPGATRAGLPTGLFTPVDVPTVAVRLYPNPATAATGFELDLARGGALDWVLLAADGRVVRSGRARLNAGTHRVALETGALPAGSYYLHGRAPGGLFSAALVR